MLSVKWKPLSLSNSDVTQQTARWNELSLSGTKLVSAVIGISSSVQSYFEMLSVVRECASECAEDLTQSAGSVHQLEVHVV
jgi:hypothetical protein